MNIITIENKLIQMLTAYAAAFDLPEPLPDDEEKNVWILKVPNCSDDIMDVKRFRFGLGKIHCDDSEFQGRITDWWITEQMGMDKDIDGDDENENYHGNP